MYKFALILIILSLFLPFSANAAILDGPIVPCETEKNSEACTLCHIFEMGKNIIDFIVELLFIIAPVFILAGGIMILTAGAKPDQVGVGKKIITSAIVGVLIALLAWTVLSMIFNALVGEEGFPWPWNEVQCSGGGLGGGTSEDRCDEMSSAGYCFSNEYSCQEGIIDQISQASSEIRNLLNCMKDKLPSTDAREISSITDNSGGRCFNNWENQCSGFTDSCTGTCCGHSQNSLHYGGVNCRGTSYAVDFAKESFFNYIHNAAKTCATDLNFGKVDVIHEGNHVHVELEGIAKSKGCI